jgi:hypothetical protein
LAASLGLATGTLHYNCGCAYANEFPITFEDLDVSKLRTTVQEAKSLHGRGEGIIWLEGLLGSEPRLVIYKVRLEAKVRQLGEADISDGNWDRARLFGLYSGTQLITEKKITEKA